MHRNQQKFCTVCQVPQTIYIVHCLPDSTDTLLCELSARFHRQSTLCTGINRNSALSARFHRQSTLCTVCLILQTLYIVNCLPDSTDNLHYAPESTEILHCLPGSTDNLHCALSA